MALVTNQTGVDEKSRRSVDLLMADPRAQRAGVRLVKIFAPEHGVFGTLDRPGIEDARDERTGQALRQLQLWLHRPGSNIRREDLATLLAPFTVEPVQPHSAEVKA